MHDAEHAITPANEDGSNLNLLRAGQPKLLELVWDPVGRRRGDDHVESRTRTSLHCDASHHAGRERHGNDERAEKSRTDDR
jgi:hypothetical protein